MKYTVFLSALLYLSFFCGCGKKDLPDPNPLNAANTNYPQQGSVASLTAPCENKLVNNKISFSIFADGTSSMAFSPTVTSDAYGIYIVCTAYASYNSVKITLPSRGVFVGKVKYSVQNTYPSSTVALASHVVGGYYYGLYYNGIDGFIYADYTASKITLSFCDVKVKDSYSNEHTITGKVTIPNTY